MKRIFLFILTNVLVVAVLGVVASLLGVNKFLTSNGLNLGALLGFALIMGFGGAIISLLISKPMAKWTTGAQVINQPQSADEAWLLDTVRQLSQRAQLDMPEVAIYEGEPNAFATGAFRNSALVAVSTGLLQGMTREEVEAVLAHEIGHYKRQHLPKRLLTMSIISLALLWALFQLFEAPWFYQGLGVQYANPATALALFSLAMPLCLLPLTPLSNALSRKHEYEADAYAAETSQAHALIHALVTMYRENAATLTPDNLYSLFHDSHPPAALRIAHLESTNH